MSESNIRDRVVQRPTSTTMDAILGKKFTVLNDGFVRVVDYMGTDASVVQAARVSYGVGTKKTSEDRALIRYLMRHGHTSPFEMCELKLHVRAPMDCWRQWIRHRTANVNEYSTRYSVAIQSMQRTSSNAWRRQSPLNRQGSAEYICAAEGASLSNRECEVQQMSRQVYQERLEAGVAREQARKDLPLSTYTEAYWKIDLHNLLHFLSLRMAEQAQWEIRQYAALIGNQIVAAWCPKVWEAFRDYALEGLRLTSLERTVIALVIGGRLNEACAVLKRAGLLQYRGDKLLSNRERDELEMKLVELGLQKVWE